MIFLFQYTAKTSVKGFTLIEVLVAISLLLVIIVGPMEIIIQSTRSTEFSIEQTTAFFLAQEGVELMQNVHNQYVLADYAGFFDGTNNFGSLDGTNDAWADFLTKIDPCEVGNGTGCYIGNDISPPGNTDLAQGEYIDIDACSGTTCRLEYEISDDEARSIFTKGTNPDGDIVSPFTREVYVEEVSPGQLRVDSVVSWRSESRLEESEVRFQTYLFKVYEPTP